MIEAPNYLSVKKALDYRLNPSLYQFTPDSQDHNSPCTDSTDTPVPTKPVAAVFLFADPENKITKEVILPHIEDYHSYSKGLVYIFCAGYGAYWDQSQYGDGKKVVTLNGTDWCFSKTQLNQLAREIVDECAKSSPKNISWQYSGKTEVLIVKINPASASSPLDFSSYASIVFDDQGEENNDIHDFFYQLVNFVMRHSDNFDPQKQKATFCCENKEGIIDKIINALINNTTITLQLPGISITWKKPLGRF